jgi:DNA polymerase I-like protein with 3'-5' exonuclease and polymerase domains
MTVFIDIDGLTLGDGDDYATALNLTGERIRGHQRLSTLKQLREQAFGYTILTGPIGARYWSLVPPTIRIKVVPDDYEWKTRTSDEQLWSYLALGLSDTDAKALHSLKSPPTKRHRFYEVYRAATELQLCLLSEDVAASEQITVTGGGAIVLQELGEQLNLLNNLNELSAIDLEWTYGEGVEERLIGINVSTRDNNWYLPILARDFDNSAHNLLYKSVLRSTVSTATASAANIFHNGKADFKQFTEDPLDLFGSNVHDTILMAYIADEQKLGLKELTEKLLGREAYTLPPNLETQPIEIAAQYGAAGDSRNTFDLFQKLKDKLHATSQYELYDRVERPLVPLVSSMEKYGSPLDIDEVKRLREEYTYIEAAIRSHIWAKHRLDFEDDKQHSEYVERLHGYNLGTLDKRVLSRIPDVWMDSLLGYRAIRTLRRNFLDAHIRAYTRGNLGSTGLGDYRAYPTFNQAGRDTESGGWLRAPATGRFSSARPNFQNQPREIRACFTAPAGHSVVSLDYSALELRVAAAISEDPVMLEVLRRGDDIHEYMRQRILEATGVLVARITAKNSNFNLRYGGTGDRLIAEAAKARATLDLETAERIVRVDRETYEGYWKWYEGTVDSARRLGYSETLHNRRRYLPDLYSSDFQLRSGAERAAANNVIQGTAADVIKIAMARVVPIMQYYKAHMAIQVHDELVFWVPTEKAEAFKLAAIAVMESVEIPHLRLLVEGGIGDNWYSAKAA